MDFAADEQSPAPFLVCVCSAAEALGDAVGSSGVGYLADNRCLAKAIRSLGAHFTVVNAENSADGNGILPQSAEELFDAGADILTGGNHTFRRREIYHMLDDCENLLRPANLPAAAQGHGWTVYDAAGIRILVMNLLGTVFMEPLSCPFEAVEKMLAENAGEYCISFLDIHAEATSEKLALAYYFDGRISAVCGTHTHVQTSDARVLPGGTGYITDLGMTGAVNSVLGIDPEQSIGKFMGDPPRRYESAKGPVKLEGCIFEIDPQNGRCLRAESVRLT